jgi:large subunit ribosomal protein L21
MYAIIRAGGKQAKVQSGDVIDIERVKGDNEQLTFAPLLVVDDKGNAVSDRGLLAKASVTAKVLGESQGPKIDIFKYKNKTGYRRRQGHRQKYIRIEITGIELPGATKAKSPAKETEPKPAATKATATKTPAAKETAAKTSAAKTTAKPAAAKTTAAKTTAKPAAAKATAVKTTAKPAAAKTAKPAKADSSEEE